MMSIFSITPITHWPLAVNSVNLAVPEVDDWKVRITFWPMPPYAVSFVQPITGPLLPSMIFILAYMSPHDLSLHHTSNRQTLSINDSVSAH